MGVTKTYRYVFRYDSGSTDVTGEIDRKTLWLVVWRACVIPEHRIEINTHDDPADSRDVGLAITRLQPLQRRFLSASIPEERIELRPHPENCCKEVPIDYARRAEISLFPRIANLSGDPDEYFLSYDEVNTLQSAREAVIFEDLTRYTLLCEQHTQADWRRILGYDSLDEWADAGAFHSLYSED
ncbi:MAG: hypothetical protein HOH43_09275 [Candidatus Latescibacteria bacterium]|jgi:hypothetical protein|nr:hypothetical protein [Candidatus Latescibacterota bacterium]